MFNLGRIAVLFALVSLSQMTSLTAWESCEQPSPNWECCEQPSSNRLYIGGYGGGIYSDSSHVHQYGTAFFTEAAGGPLAVIAEGRLNSSSAGFGGVQIGYEWSKPLCSGWLSGWTLSPAAEVEAFFYEHKRRGHLINQTVLGLPEHDFLDSFHMNSSVILANMVLSIKNECLFGISPYVGGGIGATRVSISKANSLQVAPLEAGINHFNSNRHDSSWAFAAQVKAGLRYSFCQMFHIFAEYRYLYVDSSNYIFGATNVLGHVPTTAWNVKVRDVNYNAFAIGIQFDL